MQKGKNSNLHISETIVKEPEHSRVFKAITNPFSKHLNLSADKADDASAFTSSKAATKAVKEWERKCETNIRIPESLFDAPTDKYKRIMDIIEEEVNKRYAKESYETRFMRLRREIEDQIGDKKLPPSTPKKGSSKFEATKSTYLQTSENKYSINNSFIKILESTLNTENSQVSKIHSSAKKKKPSQDFIPLIERRPKVLKPVRKLSVQPEASPPLLLKEKETQSLKDVLDLYIEYLEGLAFAGDSTDVI